MKIIDTNAVNHILKNNLTINEDYFITPDIKDESEITELIFGKKLSDRILDLSREVIFDEIIYVRNYQDILNKYKGRSFYNMTGFGDISILAALGMLKKVLSAKPLELFHNPKDSLIVITEDASLIKKIEKEFNLSEKDQAWKIKIMDNKGIL